MHDRTRTRAPKNERLGAVTALRDAYEHACEWPGLGSVLSRDAIARGLPFGLFCDSIRFGRSVLDARHRLRRTTGVHLDFEGFERGH